MGYLILGIIILAAILIAYNAIKNVEQEQDKDDVRFHQLLNTLFSLCELADFHIEGRVVLKDKRTGKVWR